jgi:hypothetical protein
MKQTAPIVLWIFFLSITIIYLFQEFFPLWVQFLMIGIGLWLIGCSFGLSYVMSILLTILLLYLLYLSTPMTKNKIETMCPYCSQGQCRCSMMARGECPMGRFCDCPYRKGRMGCGRRCPYADQCPCMQQRMHMIEEGFENEKVETSTTTVPTTNEVSTYTPNPELKTKTLTEGKEWTQTLLKLPPDLRDMLKDSLEKEKTKVTEKPDMTKSSKDMTPAEAQKSTYYLIDTMKQLTDTIKSMQPVLQQGKEVFANLKSIEQLM